MPRVLRNRRWDIQIRSHVDVSNTFVRQVCVNNFCSREIIRNKFLDGENRVKPKQNYTSSKANAH